MLLGLVIISTDTYIKKHNVKKKGIATFILSVNVTVSKLKCDLKIIKYTNDVLLTINKYVMYLIKIISYIKDSVKISPSISKISRSKQTNRQKNIVKNIIFIFMYRM